jgi:hypothetical protein
MAIQCGDNFMSQREGYEWTGRLKERQTIVVSGANSGPPSAIACFEIKERSISGSETTE